jgi:tetratricopeptide (TPR) repeat protein
VAFGNASSETATDTKRPPTDRQRAYDQAQKAYQQALQIEPNNPDALIRLARLHNGMGDQARAVAAYHKAIQRLPKQAALWYELGMCHARQKEWEPALESLRQAALLEPDQKVYGRAFAFGLARTGRFDESWTAFAKVDGEAMAHYNLARMLHHMEKDELSKWHVLAALARQPNLTSARALLAALENPYAATDKPTMSTELEGFVGDASQSPDPFQAVLPDPVQEVSPE